MQKMKLSPTETILIELISNTNSTFLEKLESMNSSRQLKVKMTEKKTIERLLELRNLHNKAKICKAKIQGQTESDS